MCGTADGRPKPDKKSGTEATDDADAEQVDPSDARQVAPPAADRDTSKRWCLFDEAADFFSRHATRRVLRCSTAAEFATLLETDKLVVDPAASLGTLKRHPATA